MIIYNIYRYPKNNGDREIVKSGEVRGIVINEFLCDLREDMYREKCEKSTLIYKFGKELLEKSSAYFEEDLYEVRKIEYDE